MSITRLLSPLILAVPAALAVASPETPPKAPLPVVITDWSDFSFPRDTFPRKGAWWGLFCEQRRCEIRAAEVSVGSAKEWNPVLEEDEPTDAFKVAGRPLAVFHGLALQPGPVPTWFRPSEDEGKVSIDPLRKRGRWQMPWGTRPMEISRVKLTDPGGFRYHLSSGATRQFLLRAEVAGKHGGDTTPQIRWVGDLDRDGAADLLMTLPDENCGFDIRLYLSSAATQGQVLGKAAQLAGRYAVCGC